MVAELARMLDVPPAPGESLEQTLVSALTGREMLIVLDNFEHLLQASDVVAGLLAHAPGVDVLSTSREPLRIRGEQRMEVPPLPSTMRPSCSSPAPRRSAPTQARSR